MTTTEKTLTNLTESLGYQLRALNKEIIDKNDFINAMGGIYDYYTNL